MAYLKESEVRAAALEVRLRKSLTSATVILKEATAKAAATDKFDVFLCHSIRDADLVLGAKQVLELQNLTVYVDWIVDPKLDRSQVTAKTAQVLRRRMKNSRALFYLYSENSTQSRWMPWELGYFDGSNGAVAILPIEPDGHHLNFAKEEYLGLYPKVEIQRAGIFVNRTQSKPVPSDDHENYSDFNAWVKDPRSLRM